MPRDERGRSGITHRGEPRNSLVAQRMLIRSVCGGASGRAGDGGCFAEQNRCPACGAIVMRSQIMMETSHGMARIPVVTTLGTRAAIAVAWRHRLAALPQTSCESIASRPWSSIMRNRWRKVRNRGEKSASFPAFVVDGGLPRRGTCAQIFSDRGNSAGSPPSILC